MWPDEPNHRLKKIPPGRFLKPLSILLRRVFQCDRQISPRGGGSEEIHLRLDEVQNLFLQMMRLGLSPIAVSMDQRRDQLFPMQRLGGLERRDLHRIQV